MTVTYSVQAYPVPIVSASAGSLTLGGEADVLTNVMLQPIPPNDRIMKIMGIRVEVEVDLSVSDQDPPTEDQVRALATQIVQDELQEQLYAASTARRKSHYWNGEEWAEPGGRAFGYTFEIDYDQDPVYSTATHGTNMTACEVSYCLMVQGQPKEG